MTASTKPRWLETRTTLGRAEMHKLEAVEAVQYERTVVTAAPGRYIGPV